jgi:penicillin-binding protein 1A
MAISPRQTGSSIKLFVLAAALQAGAQPDDLIDGAANCSFDVPDQEPFVIRDAVPRQTDTLAAMTWYSINCAYVRLAQIVGLNRMVDTVYRMSQSVYLYPGQPEGDRPAGSEGLQPLVSFSTGANEMSPMDMASGAQTIANGGLHHEPYYVERVETSAGEVLYAHQSAGTQVLDRGVALTAVDVMKGVLQQGTARRYPLADGRPASGKTGTQADNTNAWFVGFTPEITTAVWIGDPNGYTPMRNVPEFDVSRVQGGLYPAQIWKTYMDAALAGLPHADWEAPPVPARPAARLYLPGNECLFRTETSGGDVVGTVPPAAAPGPGAAAPGGPTGFGRPRQTPPTQPPPPTTATTPAVTTVPGPPAGTPITTPIVTRRVQIDSGTTVPPDVLDPRAPIPSVPIGTGVYAC